jgi:flagellar motility protein MotE (MotC chaperone)
MEEGQERMDMDRNEEMPATQVKRWLAAVAVVLILAAGMSMAYIYHQQSLFRQLSAHDEQMNATISELRNQTEGLAAKLNEMTAAQQAAAATANAPAGSKKTAAKRQQAVDKRYKQLQAQLDDEKKQLKETEDEVAKNRSDLEGSLSSTRDELNGSIARTHEELVVLAKRGERSYFEFDLTKAKQFQRVGPITLSLRRVDAKHKNYDLQMVVDDNQLTKKRVNLYEPVWIHTENESQPVQVVVNRIERNLVHGYVSAPKYKNSELATSLTPVSAPAASSPNTDSSSTPPKQPE